MLQYKKGYKEGFTSGLLAGQLMLGALINRLIMSGRSAEVGKAATDSNFRNKLYKEYDIKPEEECVRSAATKEAAERLK